VFVIGCCTACATKCQECVPVDDSKESSKEMVIGPRDCAKCEPGYVLTTPTQCDGQIFLQLYSVHFCLYLIIKKHRSAVKECVWLSANVVVAFKVLLILLLPYRVSFWSTEVFNLATLH